MLSNSKRVFTKSFQYQKHFANTSQLAIDSAEFLSWKDIKAVHATTNPSIIIQAAENPEYHPLLEEAISYGKQKGLSSDQQLRLSRLKTTVNFGREILSIVPGHVSTQVDPRISYDKEAIILEAKALINLYEEMAIPRERILIKIPTTWEGLLAAKTLQEESIECNMTTVLSIHQAIAAAQMGIKCIAPYVSKVSNWVKKHSPTALEDPGVTLVKEIFAYYVSNHHATLIMAASFQSLEQVHALEGCPIITLKPSLLREVLKDLSTFPLQLDPKKIHPKKKITIDSSSFHRQFKLKELFDDCINQFIKDTNKLESIL